MARRTCKAIVSLGFTPEGHVVMLPSCPFEVNGVCQKSGFPLQAARDAVLTRPSLSSNSGEATVGERIIRIICEGKINQ